LKLNYEVGTSSLQIMNEHSNEWIPWHWHLWQLVISEFDFSFPKFVLTYNNYFIPSQNEIFFPVIDIKCLLSKRRWSELNNQELNLRLWFRGWEEIMSENGYQSLNMKKRCITNYNNFQLDPTQWLMMIQTKMLNYTKKEWSWSFMMCSTKDNNGWTSME
jgi:hypothetical protein